MSADLKQRAEALIPWATSGWSGYVRGVRDTLSDARLSSKRGDMVGASYWLEQAERIAERHAPDLDDCPSMRTHTGELVKGPQSYRELWALRASLGDEYIASAQGF